MSVQKILCCFLILVSSCSSAVINKDKILFKEVLELFEAVDEENWEEITRIIVEEEVDVNYQEPKFGETLLIWATDNDKLISVQTLLKHGADPNIHDNYRKRTAIISAASKYKNSEYLELMLEYGANVNDTVFKDTCLYCTPLMAASATNLDNVQLLVDLGANIEFTSNDGDFALRTAVKSKRIEIAYYLIIEQGADFKRNFGFTHNGKELSIVDGLRRWTPELDSEKYFLKLELIKFLKEHGIDYDKAPIPFHYYDIYDDEYLEKY